MGEGGCSVRVRIKGRSSHFEMIFNEAQHQEETCLNTTQQFFSCLKEVSIPNAFLKGFLRVFICLFSVNSVLLNAKL